MFTSRKLSEKLKDNGCKLESSSYRHPSEEIIYYHDTAPQKIKNYYPHAYDILNDICVKYAKEFFGDTGKLHSIRCRILDNIANGNIQEAEDYIWKHCLFNKNNK